MEPPSRQPGIPVTERLPEYPRDVLIWKKNAGTYISVINNLDEFKCWMMDGGKKVTNVTTGCPARTAEGGAPMTTAKVYDPDQPRAELPQPKTAATSVATLQVPQSLENWYREKKLPGKRNI